MKGGAMRWGVRVVLLACFTGSLQGCLSIGAEFPTPTVETIKTGVTTTAELKERFGAPTQVGIEDGDQTWTWVYVRAGASRTLSKQLHVKFDERGVVKAYSYTSNLPEEVQQKTR
jgi:hypothetical protein